LREHNGERARFSQQRRHCGRRYRKDDVGPQGNDFPSVSLQFVRIVHSPTIVDADVTAVAPVEFLERLAKRGKPTLRQRVFVREGRQHSYPTHSAVVLRVRRERPSCGRAEKGHEFPPPHALLLRFWNASYHTALDEVVVHRPNLACNWHYCSSLRFPADRVSR
jgi:hypothetical protein